MNASTPRHILLINPNTTVQTTERLHQVLLPRLPAGVQLSLRTARFGARYIACEASHAVAAHACLDAWAHAMAGAGGSAGAEGAAGTTALAAPPDAVLIGCFGDPGLFALREVSACPVTSLAEASFIQAARLGPFAIVTGGERWKPMLQRLAQSLGYGELLRHIETVAPSGAALQADRAMALRCLSEACTQAVAAGGPQLRSIILGGAGLAGYAQELAAACPLPLIDSAQAGLDTLLAGLAPAARVARPGFFTQWQDMPAAFGALQAQ